MSEVTSQESFNRYKKYSTDLKRYYKMPGVQTSLSLVLSLFITAFFIFVAIRPTLVTITTLNNTIAESETTLAQMNAKSAALQTISQNWVNIEPLQNKLGNSIPSKGPAYQSITKAIEVLGAESGITIKSATYGSALTYSAIIDPYTGKKRTIVKLPYSLSVGGAFENVTKFMDQLATMDRLLSIENLTFTKDTKVEVGDTGISFTISGNMGYLADKSLIDSVLEVNEGTENVTQD